MKTHSTESTGKNLMNPFLLLVMSLLLAGCTLMSSQETSSQDASITILTSTHPDMQETEGKLQTCQLMYKDHEWYNTDDEHYWYQCHKDNCSSPLTFVGLGAYPAGWYEQCWPIPGEVMHYHHEATYVCIYNSTANHTMGPRVGCYDNTYVVCS